MSKCIQISGKQASLFIKDEAVFGQSEHVGFYKIPFNSLSLSETQSTVKSDEISAGKEPSRPGKGNIELTGSMEMYMRSESLYPLFKNIFGSVSTSIEGSLFNHTFENTEGCSDSIQLDVAYKGEAVNYKNKGVKLNNMSFNLVEEGDAKVSFDLIGSRQKLEAIIPDSSYIALEADANINSKTLDIVAGAEFDALSVGDTIVFVKDAGTVAEDATDVKTIKLSTGHGVERYDNIVINDVEYDVISVSGDLVSVTENITVLTGDVVSILNDAYKIESIDAGLSTITVDRGLKSNAVIGDEFVVQVSNSVKLSGKAFNNFNVSIQSSEGRLTTGIESFSFSFNTNKEGKRDINSSGTVSSITDGDIELTVELGLLFTHDKAYLLNDAKNGLSTDMIIEMKNDDGETLRFTLPQGDLTGATPEITPAGISTSITFTPYATDSSKMLKVELINGKTY